MRAGGTTMTTWRQVRPILGVLLTVMACAGGTGDAVVSAPDVPVAVFIEPDTEPPVRPADVATMDGETAVNDAGPGPVEHGCITDSDCPASAVDDACAVPQVCLDYVCQPDPAVEPACPVSADPCVSYTCDPATGSCDAVYVCECVPLASGLTCAGAWSYSTADGGATASIASLPCGPLGGEGGEHVWIWEATVTEVVMVQVLDGVEGVSSVHVLDVNDGACVPTACVGGGVSGAAFAAESGHSYAVVVEHGDAFPALVTLGLVCGVDTELDCGDGLDEDLDGDVDCDDSDCAGAGPCQATGESDCSNGVDDDQDGAADCDDADCAEAPNCWQPCYSGLNVGCGFGQGMSTGGGASWASTYPCGPDAPGKEQVYGFQHGAPVTVTLGLDVDDEVQAGLYLMQDQGAGCTAGTCLAYGESTLTFQNEPGEVYYVAIDGLEADVTVTYWFSVDCAGEE